MRKLSVLIVIVIGLCSNTRAQFDIKDSSAKGFLFNLSYAPQLPGGDLAKRFGFNSNAQLGVYYKTLSNWIFGIQGAYIFGNVLKESGILDSIATSTGQLIANDGTIPSISYFERGYDIQLTVGKVFAFKKPNPNSGILLMLSAGYIRHKIYYVVNGDVPQLSGAYLQGYDRLTAGYCITELLGYQYLSNHRMLNFYGGFEFTQGFTKSLRYDFDLRSMNTKQRYDLLNGFRVGWILPIYKQNVSKFYTY